MDNLSSILRTLGGLAIVIVFCLAILLSGCADVEKPDNGGNEYIESESDIGEVNKADSEILEETAAGDYTVRLIGEGVYRDDAYIYADSLKVAASKGDEAPLNTRPVSDLLRTGSENRFLIPSGVDLPSLTVYEMESNGNPCYVIKLDNYGDDGRAISQLFGLKEGKVFSLNGDFSISNEGVSEVAMFFEAFAVDKESCTLYSPEKDRIRYSFDFESMTDESKVYTYTAFYAPLSGGMPNPFAIYDGDYNVGFCARVDEKLSINYSIAKIIGSVALESWLEEVREADYTSVALDGNIYSCMKHFGFSKDEMREYLENNYLGGAEYTLTQEEIELLISDDTIGIAEYFAADNPIRKGENLYSLMWIYSHPIEDYIAAGITPADISEKLPLFDNYPLTEEAKAAFNEKVAEFLDTAD